jgi:hypothetical protein
MPLNDLKPENLENVVEISRRNSATHPHVWYCLSSPRKSGAPQPPWSFSTVDDFLVGLIFVLMVLAPAILASLQTSRWSDEEE